MAPLTINLILIWPQLVMAFKLPVWEVQLASILAGGLITLLLAFILFPSFVAYLKQCFTKKLPRVEQVFKVVRRAWPRLLAANSLISLVLFASVLPLAVISAMAGPLMMPTLGLSLFIPLLLSVLFLYTNFFIVLEGEGALAAIKKSVRVGETNYPSLLLLVAVFAAMHVLIFLIPDELVILEYTLSYFLIFPWYQLALLSFYLQRIKRKP